MAEVEDLNDTGIGDLGHRARFVEEPLDDLFVRRQRWQQHLNRCFAAEQRMLAEVNSTHPTLTDLFQEAVRSNNRARFQQDERVPYSADPLR